MILNEQAGIPVFTSISICDASSQISVVDGELEINWRFTDITPDWCSVLNIV